MRLFIQTNGSDIIEMKKGTKMAIKFMNGSEISVDPESLIPGELTESINILGSILDPELGLLIDGDLVLRWMEDDEFAIYKSSYDNLPNIIATGSRSDLPKEIHLSDYNVRIKIPPSYDNDPILLENIYLIKGDQDGKN